MPRPRLRPERPFLPAQGEALGSRIRRAKPDPERVVHSPITLIRTSNHGYSIPHSLLANGDTMPQSLAKVYVHLVFSTKNREPVLSTEWREELFQVLGGTANNLGCRRRRQNQIDVVTVDKSESRHALGISLASRICRVLREPIQR